jgi:hypothetical protein
MAPDSRVELRISGRQHVSSCPSNNPSDINIGILSLVKIYFLSCQLSRYKNMLSNCMSDYCGIQNVGT